jgi:hypothetical protein
MALEVRNPVGSELFDELVTQGDREARSYPDVMQHTLLVVKTEEQGPYAVSVFVPPEPADDAVGGAFVLDLQHDPLTLTVGEGPRLGDHTVEPRPLKAREPVPRDRGIRRRRSQIDRRLGVLQDVREATAP